MKVYEIFTSIDGEVNFRGQGGLATFIRLAGCNLSCTWCDVPNAQQTGDNEMRLNEVVATVEELGCPNITITGGEPLLQGEEVWILIESLKYSSKLRNPTFSIETNGTISPFKIFRLDDDKVSFVVDYKLPSSGLKGKSATPDFAAVYKKLRSHDWIKCVIADSRDYEIAKYIVESYSPHIPARFAFSPLCIGTPTRHFGLLASQLADWMIRDRLWNVLLSCQIHKLIDMP